MPEERFAFDVLQFEASLWHDLHGKSAIRELYKRGISFEIEGEEVDGMDVLAVKEAGTEAVQHAESGKGPFILEMKTY